MAKYVVRRTNMSANKVGKAYNGKLTRLKPLWYNNQHKLVGSESPQLPENEKEV